MKTEMINRLFSDSFTMMNFEITFEGVKAWFAMSGNVTDDASLFLTLLNPEHLNQEERSRVLQMIIYRYEDVFFQTHRSGIIEDVGDCYSDINEPVHQLLLRMMNRRMLHGEQEMLLDLYLILQHDRQLNVPVYPLLHNLFTRKWDENTSASI